MLTRAAGFPPIKTVQAFDFGFATGGATSPDPGTCLAQLRRAQRECRTVEARRAPAKRTSQHGWKVRFTSAADLSLALETAQRQGRMKEGDAPLGGDAHAAHHRERLLTVRSRAGQPSSSSGGPRYEKGLLILPSNLASANWHEAFAGDAVLTDAMLVPGSRKSPP